MLTCLLSFFFERNKRKKIKDGFDWSEFDDEEFDREDREAIRFEREEALKKEIEAEEEHLDPLLEDMSTGKSHLFSSLLRLFLPGNVRLSPLSVSLLPLDPLALVVFITIVRALPSSSFFVWCLPMRKCLLLPPSFLLLFD